MAIGRALLFSLFAIGLGGVAVALPKVTLKELTNSAERIRSHGYPAESHYVETSDGYVLNMFRLPYSQKLRNQDAHRPVILLQHGLLSNSDCWLSSGPDNSLAYILVDAGYDVWLGNARGNLYSRRNTLISTNHPNFWHFDWHEIGTIDLAAMIDYVSTQTGQRAVHYAGHSQGTTAYFVLMSERPEYNERIKSAHMLAPCAFFGHGTSPVFRLLSPLIGTPGGAMNAILADMELLPQNQLINRMIDTSCGEQPALGHYCKNMYLWFVGDGYQNTNMSSLQALIETHPAGASSNQGIHYIQLHVSGEFRQFDHGPKKNQQIYNQSMPPNYDLSKITAPTYLYSSKNDALCVPADVDTLVAHMPHLADDYRLPEPTWNHLDFIDAMNVKEMINDRVVRICNEHEGKF